MALKKRDLTPVFMWSSLASYAGMEVLQKASGEYGALYAGQALHDAAVFLFSLPGGDLIRGHMSSFAGALALGFVLHNAAALDIVPKFIRARRDEIVPALSMAALTLWEGMTMRAGRFDWGDMAVYGVAMGLVYAAAKFASGEASSAKEKGAEKPAP